MILFSALLFVTKTSSVPASLSISSDSSKIKKGKPKHQKWFDSHLKELKSNCVAKLISLKTFGDKKYRIGYDIAKKFYKHAIVTPKSGFEKEEMQLFFKEHSSNSRAKCKDEHSSHDLRKLGNELVKTLRMVFNKTIATGKMLDEFLNSYCFFIHKAGDTKDPEYYRSIGIQNPILRIFMKILNNRITEMLEK